MLEGWFCFYSIPYLDSSLVFSDDRSIMLNTRLSMDITACVNLAVVLSFRVLLLS